jgi:ATPase associated with various cellular activities AAA_5
MVMGKLTLDSTFENIRELIEGDDKCFVLTAKKMAEYENENIKNAFFFLMAMALGGADDKEPYGKKFIELVECDKKDWSENARKFVDPNKKECLRDKYNALLKELKSVSLREIKASKELKIKNNDDKDIFSECGKNWYFKGTPTHGDGKDRAKEDLNAAIDCMIKLYERIEKIENTQYLLLLSNKQLIMNGAPGTGKTYLARNDIADLLLFNLGESEDVKKNLRLGMVQFHPSYDYTDFIDGIRPNLSSGELKYTLKNGSFKSFCRRAGVIERILAAEEKVNKKNIEKFLKGEDKDIIDYWKKEIDKGTVKNFNVSKLPKLPKFLFIIDEINRAEVSKVLGEVMYCLDPDYRGSDGAISTQYSSLATDETFFISKENDKFFIPSNVYIIGTMNDIDRSVEVFDFALRRRFAWYEIKADDVMDSVLRSMNIDTLLGNDYVDYKTKIEQLNNAIKGTPEGKDQVSLGLNEHYCIGPSYFAKIKLYLDSKDNYAYARKKVWDNHIIQILNEYVKGKRKEIEIGKIRKNFIPEFDSNDKKES